MKKIIQRVTSMLLCAVLLLQMVPAVSVHVHAEGSDLVFTQCDPASLADGLQTGCYYLLVAIVNDGEDSEPVYYTPEAFDENLRSYDDELPIAADGSIHLPEDTTLPLLRYQEMANGAGLFLRDGSMLYLGEDGHELLSAEEAAALTEHNIQYQVREDGPGVGFYTEHIGAEGTYYTYLVFETLAEFNVYSNVRTTEELESAWGFYLYSATLYDHEHVLGKPVGVDANICQYSCTVEGCDYTENQEHIWDGDWAYLDASGHAKTCTACGYVYTQQHRASYRDLGDGTHSLTCSICNPETKPEPHQWSYASYDAEQDTHVYLCEQCNAEKNSPLHLWGEAEYLEYPTCDYPGLSGATCTAVDCEATAEWEVAPLGHDLTEWYTMSESTETTHGKQIRYCRNCGKSEIWVIPMPGHTHNMTPVEANDYYDTIGYYYCSEQTPSEATAGCGGKYLDEAGTQQVTDFDLRIKPCEHKWDEWVTVEGTAVASGYMECVCTVCGEIEQVALPAAGHVHEMYLVEATKSTCTMQGNKEYYICLNERLYDESGMTIGYQGYWNAEGSNPLIAGEERLPTAAHTDFEWVNEGEDYHSRKCADCGYGERASHTYSPYYQKNGITETVCRRVCVTCGDEEFFGEKHAPDNYKQDCGDGEHHQTSCMQCGKILYLEHDWWYNEGYESDEGYVEGWHSCMSCSAIYEGEEPHIWVADGEPTLPTCTGEGSQHYICAAENCEGKKTEFSDPLGHSNQTIPGKDPTCTATGLTDGLLCTVCDTVTKEQEEIPMLEHPDEDDNFFCDECQANLCFDKHPDENLDYYCDNCQVNLCFDKHPDENNDYYCDNCQTNLCFDQHVDENSDYICDQCQINLCTNHVMVHVPASAASCTAAGNLEHWRCDACERLYWDEMGVESALQEDLTLAAGHSYELDPESSVWTCVDADSHMRRCSACGNEDVQEHEAFYQDNDDGTHMVCCQLCAPIYQQHSWTLSEDGCYQSCDDCGADVSASAAEHRDTVYIECEEIEPTCFEPGMDGYWQCNNCGLFFDANKEHAYWEDSLAARIPALGHAFNPDTGSCDRCGLENPVYTRVTSLEEVTEEDLYIIVANNAAGQYFVLGGLDESTIDNEQGHIWCGEDGNAVEVAINEDGSISLLNQNYVGAARPSEFMIDIGPEQFDSDLDDNYGLTPIMLKLPNYGVYPFQSYSLDNTGYMGVPRFADGTYGMWDASDWIIDFYTTEADENTYRDDEGLTHAEQVARGNIGENIAEGDLLLYRSSYYAVGGAMFTLRFREYVNEEAATESYFICGEDWALVGSSGWDPATDKTPTNDTQYAVSLYRYDVPAAHVCQWGEWVPSGDGETHIRTCMDETCGMTESEKHTGIRIPAVEATCVSTGLSEGSKCAVCGMPLAEQQVTDKLPHNIVVVAAKEPTCTVPGQTESQSCNQCGVTFRLPTELPAAGHRWSQWLTSKEPTQIQNGWLLRYCLEGCGAAEKEICPAYGHVHHLVEVDGYDATCNNPGKQTYYRCEYEQQLDEDEYDDSCGCCFRDAEGTQQVTPGDMVIPATGKHEMGAWVVEHESDPEFIMYKRTCSCGEVEYRPEPRETHKHTLIYVEAAEPTCTANGAQARYACTTCPCIFKDAEGSVRMEERDQAILTEGHKYGEWRSDGEYGHSRECTQCDVVQIATKHQESPLPGDPTGKTCATACLLCDYQKSNANIHSYEALTACDDRWQHQQSCSACGFELIEDHEFGDWKYGSFVNENTGESVVGHYRICECGAMETSIEHLWDEGKETKPGYKIHTCIVDGCGQTKEEFLRCMHTCFTCGKCTAETTCPGKAPCDCSDPVPLVTTEPSFLTNNVEDPNQTYLGDILVKKLDDELDPDAKPGQEIPEEYVGLTIGIQEVPLSDKETGEPVENPYTDYVDQALSGYETQHLFDIHLLDAEGKITESSGDAQYLVRLCLDEEIVLGLQKGLLRLAHITEKGTFFYGVTEGCIPFYKLEGNLAWFWADRFSPFALVKPEAPYYGREALATLANKDALLYAYDQIVAGVEACVEKIQIYPDGTTPAVSIPELQMVMDAYTRDHTEHFWLDSKYSISYKKSSQMATAVKPTYSMTGDELAKARAKFNAAADEILHGITEEMSEFDRQLLIHDRLAARVVYDKTLAKPHVHDAYGAIVNGLAVCQGYAEALQYLLRRVGIQSFIVTGYSQDQSHAWNMVRIDGQYYHTDLTWNDQETALYHAYFNIDDHYITEDHAIYTTAYPLESCVEMEANYFTKMQTNLDDLDANSEDVIAQKMKGSINGVSFLLTESVTAEQFLYWFMDNQRDIFTKADLINIEVKTPTYTCIGREAMISFVAEDGQPPHICGNGGKVPGQAPACTTAGWKDHYRCACGKLYAEQSCKTEITNLAAWKMGAGQITATHTYSALVPAQQAVHTESQLQNGVAAHYRCTVCEEYFTESKMVTTLSSLTIKPEHVFGDWASADAAKHWKACTTCGKKAWEGAHVYTDGKCNTCGYELPKPGLSKPVVAPAGGSLTVTFAWETPITGKVLVAVYDLSGRMLGISYVESDTVDASGKTYTVAYDKSGTPRRIRAFVLNSGFAPALDLDPIELQ